MDYYDNNEPREKKGSKMWIIAIAVVALVIWQSGLDKADDGREGAIDTSSSTYGRGTDTNDDEDEEEVIVPPEEPTVTTNECGSELYGLPDYEGTSKEGDTCADAFYSDRDDECLANPPVVYDGTIILFKGESNPLLTCCDDDGTCQWEE